MLCGVVARGEITIDQKPPGIEHRTFDPAHPAPEMPPLKGAEAAITESKFDCQVGMKYQVVGHKHANDGCVATLKVQAVQVTLQLRVVIWLPIGATPKLTAHEEGHRRIVEQVYTDASRVARGIAASLDGTNVSGRGSDCGAAEKDGADSSTHRFCQAYLNRTSDVAQRVGDAYDELTAHGTRKEPTEDEAIRQAFKQVQSTDRPR